MAIKPVASFWMIFSQLCKTTVFVSTRTIFVVVQNIWWRMTGIHQKIQRSKDPQCTDKRLQVLKILTWHKFCLLPVITMRDFIYAHEDFVQPDYILENDHVSLFFFDLENDKAIYVEGKPGQLLWQGKNTPFSFFAGLLFGRRLIRVPMHIHHELADKLPDIQRNIVCISNTGRCGSTLMTRLFESTGRIIAYSEPHCLNAIAQMVTTLGKTVEVMTFTRDAMKMMFKPLKSLPDPVAYVIKPQGPLGQYMVHIKDLFPKVIFFHLYRDMEKVSPSLYKLSWVLPTVRIAYIAFRISPKLIQKNFENIGYPLPEEVDTVKDDFTSGVYQAVIHTNVFKKLRKTNDIYGLLFDDILKNPELATKAIFKLCEIPPELVQPALKAFESDSQENSPASKENLAKCPQLKYTEEDRVRGSELLVRCGYPPLSQPFRPEGTLDFQKVMEE